MADLSGLPDDLQVALEVTLNEIDDLSEDIASGELTTAAWQEQMEAMLREAFEAAVVAGGGDVDVLGDSIDNSVAIQIAFLENFAADILATGWLPAYAARARMYGLSSKAGYWTADTARQAAGRFLPLPAMPGEGTQCLTNCKCSWEIVTVNSDSNDYDAYWRRHASDSCQTCVQREAAWSPVQIRGGELL